VVTNARKPGSRCYGFVTMSSAEEAAKCIQQLHRTELHGKMISVEKVGVICKQTWILYCYCKLGKCLCQQNFVELAMANISTSLFSVFVITC